VFVSLEAFACDGVGGSVVIPVGLIAGHQLLQAIKHGRGSCLISDRWLRKG
jgi:hypothetical protein